MSTLIRMMVLKKKSKLTILISCLLMLVLIVVCTTLAKLLDVYTKTVRNGFAMERVSVSMGHTSSSIWSKASTRKLKYTLKVN